MYLEEMFDETETNIQKALDSYEARKKTIEQETVGKIDNQIAELKERKNQETEARQKHFFAQLKEANDYEYHKINTILETKKSAKTISSYLERIKEEDYQKKKLHEGLKMRQYKYFVKHEAKILDAVAKWGQRKPDDDSEESDDSHIEDRDQENMYEIMDITYEDFKKNS